MMNWLLATIWTKKLSGALGGTLAVATIIAMSFTPEMITAMSIALLGLVGAIFTGIISVITVRKKLDEVKVVTENVNTKADNLIEKAAEIHTLTDGHLHKVTEALAVANTKIEGLTKLVASMTEAKAVADHVAIVSATKPAQEKESP